MKNSGLIFCLLFAAQSSFGGDKIQVTKYKVKVGDTLSQVMEDHGIRGIYDNMKKDRHLNPMFIVAKNNGLTWEQLNQLPVGKEIYLPKAKEKNREIAADSEEFRLEDISDAEFQKIIEEYAESKE